MDFGVLVAWSALLGIVIALGFGIWYVIKDAQKRALRQIELKNLYQEKKRQGNLPTKYLPVSKFRESISESVLEDCEILYLAILEESEESKLQFATSDLTRWMNSYRVLASANLFFKKHPMLSIVMIVLLFPISWPLMIFGAVVMVFHSMQAGKMESAFSQFLNGSAKISTIKSPQNPPPAQSLAAEIQKLEDMRSKGVINDEEFSQLKKKLISA